MQRELTREWLSDAEHVDELLELLAEGATLRELCGMWDLVYPTTMRYLLKHHRDDYEATKTVRADTALDDMKVIEDKLERGSIDFNTARELLKSKQWRAERLNSGRYGQRQTIDMNVTDKTKLHLEAVRELSRRPLLVQEQPAGPALPAPCRTTETLGPPVPIGQRYAIDVPYTEVSVHSSHTTVDTTDNRSAP